ncbi:hypothetical protein J7481_22965 [Labrenzia sp. R4_2]|uniref:hypothetical protein n=1 Tax=Labrenzia sp. R4_2 TaxID=2821107 RepID=UPI001ADD4274|nr:hypothetical protein [Labrenzia sp. R4_2]MBO9422390.1 hypothetical protein [Labrenzia sp. R4_2]
MCEVVWAFPDQTGDPCAGREVSTINSVGLFAGPDGQITEEDIEGMTLGELLDLMEQASSVVLSADWTTYYQQFVDLGFANDPQYADALVVFQQFASGDFTLWNTTVDTLTTALAEGLGTTNFAAHLDTLVKDILGAEPTLPGNPEVPIDPDPADPAPTDPEPTNPTEPDPTPDPTDPVPETPIIDDPDILFQNPLLDELFDDEGYLAANPDVAAVVSTGAITAEEHYEMYGWQEGRNLSRDTSTDFNEEIYLENNPDIAAAVAAGTFSSGREHWDLWGAIENRVFSQATKDFNEDLYLELNPDVAVAVENGVFNNGREHFLSNGADEGRIPGFTSYALDNVEDEFDKFLADRFEEDFPSPSGKFALSTAKTVMLTEIGNKLDTLVPAFFAAPIKSALTIMNNFNNHIDLYFNTNALTFNLQNMIGGIDSNDPFVYDDGVDRYRNDLKNYVDSNVPGASGWFE